MITKLLIFVFAFGLDFAAAQTSSESSTSKSYPPQDITAPSKNRGDYYRTENGTVDVQANKRADAGFKKLAEALGYKHRPMQEGREDFVPDTFTMPNEEVLADCIYTQGYSYPSICLENGKVVFDSSKHTQKELNKVMKKQKVSGKYNKIPGGGPVIVEGIGELEFE